MSLHFDPFPSSLRELDRLTNQMLSGTAVPASMPMDVWRSGDVFAIALDMPGIDEKTLEVTLERGTLTIRAERHSPFGEADRVLVAERPQGAFTRQLMLGDALDHEAVEADYRDGVLHMRIPVAQAAQPRRVEVRRRGQDSIGSADAQVPETQAAPRRGTIETGAGDARSRVLLGNSAQGMSGPGQARDAGTSDSPTREEASEREHAAT